MLRGLSVRALAWGVVDTPSTLAHPRPIKIQPKVTECDLLFAGMAPPSPHTPHTVQTRAHLETRRHAAFPSYSWHCTL